VLGEGTDRHYTNGLRFTLTEDRNRTWAAAEKIRTCCFTLLCWAKPFSSEETTVGTWVFGQNMFTPDLITMFDPDPQDRPFVGYVYGGYQVTFGRPGEPTDNVRENSDSSEGQNGGATPFEHLSFIPQSTVEVTVGFLGPPALAGGAQAGMHALRGNRIPKGWRSEVPTEPTLQLVNTFRLGIRGRLLDNKWVPMLEFTPRGAVGMGTVQAYAEGGFTGRVGWNLSGLARDVISVRLGPERPAEPSWELAFVYTLLKRQVWRNAFLDGGLMADGPSADRVDDLTDERWGIDLRLNPLTFSYRMLQRTQELSPIEGVELEDHKYGSVALSWQAPGNGVPNTLGNAAAWFLDRMQVEAGFGVGTGVSEGRGANGRAARIAVGIASDSHGLALDFNGVADDADFAEADGTHTDYYFLSTGLSVWWAPWEKIWIGRPVFRLGLATATHEREHLTGGSHPEVDEEENESGGRLTLGTGFWADLPFSDQVDLAFDLFWSRLPLATTPTRRDGSFLGFTMGIRWRPRLQIHTGSG
jgi:hypothetical protein